MGKLFEYHCYEGEDSSDVILWHHTHQEVEVIRRLSNEESELPMTRVRFSDGLEYDVFEDELLTSIEEYVRPAYSLHDLRS